MTPAKSVSMMAQEQAAQQLEALGFAGRMRPSMTLFLSFEAERSGDTWRRWRWY